MTGRLKFDGESSGVRSRSLREESYIDIVIVFEDFKRKNIFKRADLTEDAEIRTIKKFMVPLDIITMTPEEYENKTTLMAEYAHEGEIVFAS